MKEEGIIAQPVWEKNRCPFCHQKLGVAIVLSHKKRYICPHCHKKIDNRFIVR